MSEWLENDTEDWQREDDDYGSDGRKGNVYRDYRVHVLSDVLHLVTGRVKNPPIEDENGCWIWQGYVDENGYPRRGSKWAHRVAYEKVIGPIPDGHNVDHLCFVPLCVNPAHLEAVPAPVDRERVRRKTHCPRGHEMTPENIYVIPSRPNTRRCHTCKLMQDRRSSVKTRGR